MALPKALVRNLVCLGASSAYIANILPPYAAKDAKTSQGISVLPLLRLYLVVAQAGKGVPANVCSRSMGKPSVPSLHMLSIKLFRLWPSFARIDDHSCPRFTIYPTFSKYLATPGGLFYPSTFSIVIPIDCAMTMENGNVRDENMIVDEAAVEKNPIFDEESPHPRQTDLQSLERQTREGTQSGGISKLSKSAPHSAVNQSASQQTTTTNSTILHKSKRKAGIEAWHRGKARTAALLERRRRRLALERTADCFPRDTPDFSSQSDAPQSVKPNPKLDTNTEWFEENTPDGRREHWTKQRVKDEKYDRLRKKKRSKK
jgi:hypothetical protein